MDQETKKYLEVRKELEKFALEKLEKIKEKIQELPSDPSKRSEDIQILVNVADELDDVLYNWTNTITSSKSFNPLVDSLDDEEDEDDPFSF